MILALVQFNHGSGCTLGQPYGECGYYCRYNAVKTFQHKSALVELDKFLKEKFNVVTTEYRPALEADRFVGI